MKNRKKKLPIGIDMFSDIRTEGFYYVDKTGFIKELLYSWGKVNLFTRPRRFGKSLNMDMLRSFFEIGTDASLFDGLLISQEKDLCDAYLGKYPVLSVSLKDVDGRNLPEAIDMLGAVVNEQAIRLQWLMESPSLSVYDKKQLERLLESDFEKVSTITGSLKLLSRLLCKHYGKKVILLIDEYDVPLDKAYQKKYYPGMVDIIRSLFSQALKTNPDLHFAVITGCLRIAKESIFTGLNNFKVRTISDVDYADYFGFTDAEVRKMLAYYGLEDKYGAIREWYDGYHFGYVDVYCPWDVINQCDKFRASSDAPMEPHWENSSSNAIVQDIIETSTAATRVQIEGLISGDPIERKLFPELTYTDLDNKDPEIRQDYLWSVLFSSGYLTEIGKPVNGINRLVIPNREVLGIYEKKIRSWFKVQATSDTSRWKNFLNAVRTGNAKEFQTLFNEFMSDSVSIRDTCVRKTQKENFYHGLLLGLLRAEGSWIVRSNPESGIGYTDILIEIPQEKAGCIFEVKYAEQGAFDQACTEAMEQISRNNYAAALRQCGMQTIHTYGIACFKKECRVLYRKET